jgi:Tfp pilus assembly protein PilV
MKKNILYITIIFLLSIPAILPLLHSGFFQTDDADWMIIRSSAFHQALKDGQIPPRFLPRLNHEYGYPVANFLYPGYMYLAEPIHLLGFNFVDTIKIILAASLLLSALFTYFWLRKFFSEFPSLIGSLLYLYTPYHLYDLYHRGSVGEILALAVVPFILWQLERRSYFWPALGLGTLIISHNTLAVLFLPLIILYMLINLHKKKERKFLITYYSLTIFFGLGMSAFFWLPAISDLQYTVFSKTNVSNWQEYFAPIQLIGISSLFVAIITVINLAAKKIKIEKQKTLMFLTLCLLSLFLSSSASFLIWKIIPASFIQFPFRLLSISILCIAFLAAYNLNILKNKNKYILSAILIVVLILSAFPFMKTTGNSNKDESFYTTNEATTTVQNEYMPKWVKQIPTTRASSKIETSQAIISNLIIKSNSIAFTSKSTTSAEIKINTIYFPGWMAQVDDKNTTINYNNPSGIMELTIPKGTHTISLKFEETLVRLIGNLISIQSFIIILIIHLLLRRIERQSSL